MKLVVVLPRVFLVKVINFGVLILMALKVAAKAPDKLASLVVDELVRGIWTVWVKPIQLVNAKEL